MSTIATATSTSSARHFKVYHQLLSLSDINFESQSILGYVEIAVLPLSQNLKQLKLNCRQCSIARTTVNGIETKFVYNDPLAKLCEGDKRRGLDVFIEAQLKAVKSVDAEKGNGELVIDLPDDVTPFIQSLKLIRVGIEFSLEEPSSCIKFVIPSQKDVSWQEKGAHMFSYKHDSSGCVCFPCVDSPSELCTWRIELTALSSLSVIASGELVETTFTEDKLAKTWSYQLNVPTCAANVGFVVGSFEMFVQPDMEVTVTQFCPAPLLPLLKHSTASMSKIFEFFEELLSTRYPFSSFQQVFVHQAPTDVIAYSSFCILSVDLLYHPKIIDQVPISRGIMAYGVAQQFFGCFVTTNSWSEVWLNWGIAGYLTGLHNQKFFGNNEYLYQIHTTLEEVTKYEDEWGGIILSPKFGKGRKTAAFSQHYCGPSLLSPQTCSPRYTSMLKKKSHLVIRMLEKKLGKELLIQVLNKLISIALIAVGNRYAVGLWSNALLTLASFVKCVSNVTGQDLQTFLDHWVHSGGHADFEVRFTFSRKRNVLELEIQQPTDPNILGTKRYLGPLSLSVQELDGAFSHTLQIDELLSKHDIQCHSKARRQKKKKIPLWTGEEVDFDLTGVDPDSPVLWIRFDPELLLFRRVRLYQPDYYWQYELKHEKDIMSQLEAACRLRGFSTAQTRTCLTEVVDSERTFYRVRLLVCEVLCEIENKLFGSAISWTTKPALITTFWRLFGSQSCENIVKPNDFTNFQHYHLMKKIFLELGKLRNGQGCALPVVVEFLLNVLKYSTNLKNKYADDYYRAALLEALSNALASYSSPVSSGAVDHTSGLPLDTKRIADEIFLCLNHEKLVPSYHRLVACSSLKGVLQLQRYEFCSRSAAAYLVHAAPGQFLRLRLTALECLTEYVKIAQDAEALAAVVDLIEKDSDPRFRFEALQLLIRNPPFLAKDSPSPSQLNTEALVNRFWSLLCSTFAHDASLRTSVADLYYLLFGRSRPVSVAPPEFGFVLNLKERKVLTGAGTREPFSEEQKFSRQAVSTDEPRDQDAPVQYHYKCELQISDVSCSTSETDEGEISDD